MIDPLIAYLPQDRALALAAGAELPDRALGAVLFADVSGFTPLTERLTDLFGPRRGIEEVSRRINAVYEALIEAVDRFQGAVIGFAGDAITCWFGGAAAELRAVACAFAQQRAMQAFAELPLPDGTAAALAVKVIVTSGPVRRFVVGDPEIQRLDTLAGATVGRLGEGEHLAQRGEVLIDEAAVAALGQPAQVIAWRTNPETQSRFAVLASAPAAPEQPVAAAPALSPATLRAWVLPAIAAREGAGAGDFVTEFRPASSLFARFGGIDYDQDDAGARLNAFIVHAQRIINDYGGTLLQLTIADKGSYIHAVFGAPIAHEDDARRALRAALELQALPDGAPGLTPLQIGLTRGVLSAGVLGSTTRRTYNTWGDEVNLAARLMGIAAPGEILVSGRAQQAVANIFTFAPRPPLSLKGKSEPLPIFAVTGARRQRPVRLQEPAYTLPMVGRMAELQTVYDRLALAQRGQTQVIGIAASAGMGKSRLIAEAIRLARNDGFAGYGGACQSDAIRTPYLVWKSIWGAFFDVDPELPLRKQIRLLEGELEDRAPDRANALPLLSAILDLPLPDNEFTQKLEPQYRRSALHALLEDCLKSAAGEEPILLVLEDVQWIDALSFELLEQLVRAAATYPLCVLMAYRPKEVTERVMAGLQALPNFTTVELQELSIGESEQAIRAKLAQLYPARRSRLTPTLVEKLMARAQGNPFYLEELLNYLRDRGLDPLDEGDLAKIELPDSLHALILSRIDQLSDREKLTLRVASIIGRLFRAAWLPGYYPDLGDMRYVRSDLDELNALDITPLNAPEPELSYLFKHIVTHEVAYESLPYATRAQLHELLAQYLEARDAGALPLDLLAHHYGLTTNVAKQQFYWRAAGDAAQARFANDTALDYYARLLPLLSAAAEQVDLLLQRGAVLERLGRWTEAESHFTSALKLAEGDVLRTAHVQAALGALCALRSDYATALAWLEQARDLYASLNDPAGLAQVWVETGNVLRQKGEPAAAQLALEEGLAQARKVQDRHGEMRALENLGKVARDQGDYLNARALLGESLALARTIDDTAGIMRALDNLGTAAAELSEYDTAQALHEEGLALAHTMGDKYSIAVALESLGYLANYQGNGAQARELWEHSLVLRRELGNKRGIAGALFLLANLNSNEGDNRAAAPFFQESLALAQETGDQDIITLDLMGLGTVAAEEARYADARRYLEASLALGRASNDRWNIAVALVELGTVALHQGQFDEARALCTESLELWREIGVTMGMIEALLRLAGLALQDGDAGRAVRIAAAAEAARAAIDYTFLPGGALIYTETLAAARAQLPPGEFATAWREGESSSIETLSV